MSTTNLATVSSGPTADRSYVDHPQTHNSGPSLKPVSGEKRSKASSRDNMVKEIQDLLKSNYPALLKCDSIPEVLARVEAIVHSKLGTKRTVQSSGGSGHYAVVFANGAVVYLSQNTTPVSTSRTVIADDKKAGVSFSFADSVKCYGPFPGKMAAKFAVEHNRAKPEEVLWDKTSDDDDSENE